MKFWQFLSKVFYIDIEIYPMLGADSGFWLAKNH